MDEFSLQLLELVRAGWTFQVSPEPTEDTMLAGRAVIVWSCQRDVMEQVIDGPAASAPIISWVSAFAPGELRKAVAMMHARVFPISPTGDLPGDFPEREL